MKDLFDYLYLFELKKVEHCDLHEDNVLVAIGIQTQAFVIDYGFARTTVQPFADLFGDTWDRKLSAAKAPELYRYRVMRDASLPNVKQKYEQSWRKHDIWDAGIGLFLDLKRHTNKQDWKKRYEYPIDIVEAAYAYDTDFADDESFYAIFKERSLISKPSRKSPSYFIWQMLHYDHQHRPSASQLRADFQEYLRLKRIRL